MKAKELAEILLQYPELEVVVAGYEENLNLVETIIITKIKLDAMSIESEVYGNYSYLGDSPSFEINRSQSINAIFLGYSDRVGMSSSRVKGNPLNS
ncbi:hypothetical protein [Nostoc sp. GT001]|uniref:hypothetical protein n=1 Tax=Nostoc sp. GT001 TaxID=3056647 RepID=UPI0025AAC263|nr:hypothetical protein [Nostoc sp. GT001]MDM9583119.1 hypothetical protein [Nostoc sp. GT001]